MIPNSPTYQTATRRAFERYTLYHTLGQGSLGTVYAAIDIQKNTAVAIKIFHRACEPLLQDGNARQAVHTLLRNMHPPPHPAIVPIWRAGKFDNRTFLVTPLLRGGNLRSHLQAESKGLTESQARTIFERIGPALDQAHRHGLVHGNLAPENVLFDRQGQAYLSDFGLATLVEWYLGFPPLPWHVPYQSPEQRWERQQSYPSSDIYGAGILLFEMLAGRHPFDNATRFASNPTQISNPHLSVQNNKPALSYQCQSVVERALAQSPSQRFASAAEMAEAAIQATQASPSLLAQLKAYGHSPVAAIAEKLTSLPDHPWREWRPRQPKLPPIKWVGMGLLVMLLLACAILVSRPALAARLADPMRQIIGVSGVAGLETLFFKALDVTIQVTAALGIAEAQPPWESQTAIPTPISQTPAAIQPTLPQPALEATITATPVAISPPLTPTPLSEWEALSSLPPLGDLPGEGVWTPYLYSPTGQVVGQRTFLQADPRRPLSLAAIVAFNLEAVELHYVLGAEDPSLPDGPRGTGIMPYVDRTGGHLVAAFNGGFKAEHGSFGAMSDGIVAIDATAGYATVAIAANGKVQIGDWGHTLDLTQPLNAWRQNARLVIEAGRINPAVYSHALQDWGGTINGDVVTWRSGLGLNQENNILYYLAGPGLSMPVLADTMLTTGIYNGMLLDINEYWVHFTRFDNEGGQPVAYPLLEEGMSIHIDRYLRPSPRDFFYITVK